MTNAVSSNGLALIQEFEGFQAEPKQLPTGGWVVGYSHVRLSEPGEAVNENDARDLLALDLAPFEALVNASVTQPLSQPQFDALVSFAFSIGADAFANSQVLRRAKAGDFVSAACAMDAWRKSDVSGELVVIDALVRRRAVEKALFLQDASGGATPSPFVRAQLDHAASILGAPMTFAPLPEVGSIASAQPKPEAGERLAEILMSEPATEVLLLTQVVEDTHEAGDEITTAHAKPVSRADFDPPFAPRRTAKFSDNAPVAFENAGLAALMLFGLGLLAVAVSMITGGAGDIADFAGAAAFGAPGLAAVLMTAYGLWRAPKPAPVKA